MSLRSSSRIAKLASSTVPDVAKAMAPGKKRARPSKKDSLEVEALPNRHDAPNGTDQSLLETEDGFKIPATPSPAKKRRRADPTTPTAPPLTPTPSIVGRVSRRTPKAGSASTSTDLPDVGERPAAPHRTNAALQTPAGSRVLPGTTTASPAPTPTASPSKLPGIRPHTSLTTATLLADAKAHLIKVDPSLAPLIAAHHCRIFAPEGLAEEVEPFSSLASEIMAQQISGAAASSIKKRFLELFPATAAGDHGGPPEFPSPALVAGTPVATLKTAGLSQRKAEYIQGLAERFRDGVLSARLLADATDEEVMKHLIAVRGLGAWTVEMFMCFGLKRLDVFSTGDLGVQRGCAIYKGKDVNKLKGKGGKWKYMSEQEMLDTAEKFRPYRSLFMWYTWRMETSSGQGGTNIDAMQG